MDTVNKFALEFVSHVILYLSYVLNHRMSNKGPLSGSSNNNFHFPNVKNMAFTDTAHL